MSKGKSSMPPRAGWPAGVSELEVIGWRPFAGSAELLPQLGGCMLAMSSALSQAGEPVFNSA
jgi:hypothetical protein